MKRVSIGVVANDGKVLLIKRKKQEGALLWQFPGGQVESYETSAEAAVREVNEETGIVCSPLLSLGQRMHPNTNIEIHYWACEYITGEAFVKAPDEVSEILWCEYDAIDHYITTSIFPPILDYLKTL